MKTRQTRGRSRTLGAAPRAHELLRDGAVAERAAHETSPRWALATLAPFHLEATVRVLQRRPSNSVDVWEHDRYLRVLGLPEGLALVEVENCGTIEEPDVRFSIRRGNASSTTRLGADGALRKMLGLDVDPKPLHHLMEAERALRATARALRGMRPPRFAGLFESFASVVPFQQLSLDAGVAIVARMVAKFGQHLEYDGRRFHAFPTAQAIAEARLEPLRTCGLSARKAQTLRHLARAVESGAVTEDQLSRMSTREALQTLTALPGIGPWSAALVLLRGLGRTDVFPPGDVGATRGLRALIRRGPQAPLARIIERFGEHRGYLYFCALGGWLLSRGLIHPAPVHAMLPKSGRYSPRRLRELVRTDIVTIQSTSTNRKRRAVRDAQASRSQRTALRPPRRTRTSERVLAQQTKELPCPPNPVGRSIR